MIVRKKIGIVSINFFCPFSFLDPKVKNLDITFQCPLRNQKDILDDPIPSKLTLSVYTIWSMKCRYDPKYAPQYKSKHTKVCEVI
jgi:hypothetical protein